MLSRLFIVIVFLVRHVYALNSVAQHYESQNQSNIASTDNTPGNNFVVFSPKSIDQGITNSSLERPPRDYGNTKIESQSCQSIDCKQESKKQLLPNIVESDFGSLSGINIEDGKKLEPQNWSGEDSGLYPRTSDIAVGNDFLVKKSSVKSFSSQIYTLSYSEKETSIQPSKPLSLKHSNESLHEKSDGKSTAIGKANQNDPLVSNDLPVNGDSAGVSMTFEVQSSPKSINSNSPIEPEEYDNTSLEELNYATQIKADHQMDGLTEANMAQSERFTSNYQSNMDSSAIPEIQQNEFGIQLLHISESDRSRIKYLQRIGKNIFGNDSTKYAGSSQISPTTNSSTFTGNSNVPTTNYDTRDAIYNTSTTTNQKTISNTTSNETLRFVISEESHSSSELYEFKQKLPCITHSDLFEKISDVDPQIFYERKQHPLVIPPGVSNTLPYQTNKFYTNLFVGNQDEPVFTYPYVVFWDRHIYFGLGIQSINRSRRGYGGIGAQAGTSQYYHTPSHAAGIFVSATSIRQDNCHLSMTDMKNLSAKAKLSPEADYKEHIEFPLVEGMGFVTAVYHGHLVPKIQGVGGILKFEKLSLPQKQGKTQIYGMEVGVSERWLIYVTPPQPDKDFQLLKDDGNTFLVGSKAIDGLIIQVAISSDSSNREIEKIYNEAAGIYVTDARLSGSIFCHEAKYKIAYETKGASNCGFPLIFALPHHIDLFDKRMKNRARRISAPTSTKGIMQGYLTAEFLFSHQIDTNVQWLPYLKEKSSTLKYTKDQIEFIRQVANEETKGVEIVKAVTSLDKQYMAGKAIDKFAHILYVADEILKDELLAKQILIPLKEYFEKFKTNKDDPALFYDTKFKGVTSNGAFIDVIDGKYAPPGAPIDYGSGMYNDHNFHFGYFIHAAAVVGKIDARYNGTWIRENKDFINTLVRDVANPSEQDNYFPMFRLFDWFQGHSWAHGITPSRDGKDLESTSEDVHFSYAMKLWGQVTQDQAMEARGDLMLSIQAKSFNLYFLYKDDNKEVLPEMLGNKVSGILFEGKLAYLTWFGNNPEFIHGIQMLPLTPALGLVRSATFAKEEWTEILCKLEVRGRWAGILNSNRVFFDPNSAWEYFANPSFSYENDMDGGQSRTWALAFAAPFVNQKETDTTIDYRARSTFATPK